jgi:hypothetical protein
MTAEYADKNARRKPPAYPEMPCSKFSQLERILRAKYPGICVATFCFERTANAPSCFLPRDAGEDGRRGTFVVSIGAYRFFPAIG